MRSLFTKFFSFLQNLSEHQKTVAGLTLILVLEFGFFLTACIKYWVPAYLDGFQYFHLQYFLLNHQVMHQEPALWFPYLTHGAIGIWWYAMVGNFIFQSISLLAGLASPILKNINFIHIFHFEILVDHILLLTGTWLLAGCLFQRASTKFFVTATVLGSCIWPAQIWFNFHFYYALPLMIYLGHRFLDTQKWRYLFLMGNLLAMQTLGNLPYFIPITTFTLFIYFSVWGLLNFKRTVSQLKQIKIGWNIFLCLAGILASLAGAYAMVSLNSEDIVHSNYARDEDKSSNLGVFLTYGRNTGPQKWLETLIGYSPFIDMSLFCGILTVVLFFIALINIRHNKNNHLLLTLLVLAALSAGSIISIMAFYGWPMMKFFRHLALISVIVKIFAIFFAAEGWERLMESLKNRARTTTIAMAVLLTTMATGMLFLKANPEKTLVLVSSLVQGSLWLTYPQSHLLPGLLSNIAPESLNMQLHLCFICTTALAAICWIYAGFPKSFSGLWLVTGLTLIHVINIYTYKSLEISRRTFSMADIRSVANFTPIPYPVSRIPYLWLSDHRDLTMVKFPMPQNYWTLNLFLFKDEMGQTFQTDHWMSPFNAYIKNYAGQDSSDTHPFFKNDLRNLVFPDDPRAAKISGLTEPKIQFFQHVYYADDTITASAIRHPEYSGDFILISSEEPSAKPWMNSLSPNKNFRLRIPHHVTSFTANQIVIDVNIPEGKPVWIHYADIWDKNWKAHINGQEAQIFKSNLAYKAVLLQPGQNQIVLKYDLPLWKTLYLIWNIISIIWLGGIFWLLVRIFRTPQISEQKIH